MDWLTKDRTDGSVLGGIVVFAGLGTLLYFALTEGGWKTTLFVIALIVLKTLSVFLWWGIFTVIDKLCLAIKRLWFRCRLPAMPEVIREWGWLILIPITAVMIYILVVTNGGQG